MGSSENKKRAKFDAAPTAKITGNEIFEWVEPLDIHAIRAKAVSWLMDNGYLHGNHKNTDTGMDNIIVTAKGIRNSLAHGAGPEKVQTAAALPKMIRDGVRVRTQPGKDNQPNVTEHIFAAKVDIGGKAMVVGFIVKEDDMGKRFYDHELTEIYDLDELSSQGGATQSGDRETVRTRRGRTIKILQTELAVNSNVKNSENNPSATLKSLRKRH